MRTPIQALDAALLLRAETLVPIHFGRSDPHYYVEVAEALETLLRAGVQRQQAVKHMVPGDEILLGGIAAHVIRFYADVSVMLETNSALTAGQKYNVFKDTFI